jgi:hypothetical protein
MMEPMSILAKLAECLKLPGTRLNETDGTLHVPLTDGKIAIELREGARTVLRLCATLMPPPTENRLLSCARLLEANLFASSSGGATYALDDEGRVRLLRHIPLDGMSDFTWLSEAVERIAAAARAPWGEANSAQDQPGPGMIPAPSLP